jgi:hypothetical protein
MFRDWKFRSVLLLLCMRVAPLTAQTVTLTVPSSLRVGDTVTATVVPRDVTGRIAGTATIAWITKEPRVGLFVGLPRGRTARIVAQSVGTTWIVATWTRSDKKVVKDSAKVSVQRALATAVVLYWGIHQEGDLISDAYVFGRTLQPQTHYCIYVVAADRFGHWITGATPTMSIDGEAHGITISACGDTTVDPTKAPHLPLMFDGERRSGFQRGVQQASVFDYESPYRAARALVHRWAT